MPMIMVPKRLGAQHKYLFLLRANSQWLNAYAEKGPRSGGREDP